MTLRAVVAADREDVERVEALTMPGFRYVPDVWDLFLRDPGGEFMLGREASGEAVAIAKFTRLPDRSAWLETLRVVPEAQGRGWGKRCYERFFELARQAGDVPCLRMYTGVTNDASRGLAERFGFHLEARFAEFVLPEPRAAAVAEFQPVTDPTRAWALLDAARASWGDWVVFNRTFSRVTPELSAWLVARGFVFEDAASGSVLVLGQRFSPGKGLYVGLLGGEAGAGRSFAQAEAARRGVRLVCTPLAGRADVHAALRAAGFEQAGGELIVMRVDRPGQTEGGA